MPFVFNVRSVRKREAHSPKNVDRTFPHLREWVQRADFVRRSRQRDVDPGERARFFLRSKTCRACLERSSHSITNFIEQFPDYRLFIFAEGFHPLPPLGDAAAFAEIFYARRLERLFVKGGFNFAQCIIAKLFKWMRHE